MNAAAFSTILWLLAVHAGPGWAYWRMACSVSQTARADPIVNPGAVSAHAHKFAGGINVNQNSDFNSLLTSSCSTCEVQDDKSAYWTPQLYFAHSNGTFEEVPNYGMTVYYVGRGGTANNTQPFPPGFKMISGESTARSYDETTLTYQNTRPVADRVSFRCINEANDIPETHYINETNCVNGFRAQINFQSCWDGKNLYLGDNSHVAYLSGIDYGSCPPTHPVSIPGLFFEVLYWTNLVDQSAGGQFVFSNGDPTGYGFHADFMNGWTMDVQDDAVQNCLYTDNGGVVDACPALAKSDDVNFSRDCPEQPSIFDEPVLGLLDALPGCNPITSGPAPAQQVDCPLNVHNAAGQGSSSSTSSASSLPTGSSSTSLTSSTAVSTSQNGATNVAQSSTTASISQPAITSSTGVNDSPISSTVGSSSAIETSPTTAGNVATSSSGSTTSVNQDPESTSTSDSTNQTSSSMTTVTATTPAAQSTPTSSAETTSTTTTASTSQENKTVVISITDWVTVTITAGGSAPGNFAGGAAPATTSQDTVSAAASGGMYTITGSTYTTFVPSAGQTGVPITTVTPVTDAATTVSSMSTVAESTPNSVAEPGTSDPLSEQISTTVILTTTTLYVTVTPTSTRTILAQSTSPAGESATSTQDTTLATVMTPALPGTTSITFVSSTVSIDAAMACSLYSSFSLEGCPPSTTATLTEETTSTTETTLTFSTTSDATTVFRIRGRRVLVIGG